MLSLWPTSQCQVCSELDSLVFRLSQQLNSFSSSHHQPRKRPRAKHGAFSTDQVCNTGSFTGQSQNWNFSVIACFRTHVRKSFTTLGSARSRSISPSLQKKIQCILVCSFQYLVSAFEVLVSKEKKTSIGKLFFQQKPWYIDVKHPDE